jgi:hypothetical protein
MRPFQNLGAGRSATGYRRRAPLTRKGQEGSPEPRAFGLDFLANFVEVPKYLKGRAPFKEPDTGPRDRCDTEVRQLEIVSVLGDPRAIRACN